MKISRKGIIAALVCFMLIGTGTLFAAFKYDNNKIVNTASVYPNQGKYKIEFKENGSLDSLKTMYVDSTYNLSLKDAPYVYKDGTVYEWKAGDLNLATIEDNGGGYISGDLVFIPSPVVSETTFNNTYDPSVLLNVSDGQDKSLLMTSSDYIYLDSPSYNDNNGEVNVRVQIGKGTFKKENVDYVRADPPSFEMEYALSTNYENDSDFGQINTFFTYSPNEGRNSLNGSVTYWNTNDKRYEVRENDTSSYNADCTIALADTEGKLTDYKPFAGRTTIGGDDSVQNTYLGRAAWGREKYANLRYSSKSIANATSSDYASFAATNYICKKFILNRDIVFNNVTLNLGAHNGFYGSNINWAQNNYNNFIVGAYTEIDLNGHDLILANNSRINAYGSITDSSADLGTIVAESGSTIQGLLTLEDCAHETDVVAYYFNMSLFRMFRMPYLDCSIDFKYGSSLVGYVMKDDGGKTGHGFSTTVNLIGTGDDCLIKMKDSKGHITRSVYYDNNIRYSNLTNKTERANIIRNNLYNQRIKYDVYDCSLEFNNFLASISAYTTITLNSADSQFFIPSYFEIYLHNSSVNLTSQLVFLPGSYLNVDSNSFISLSYKSHSSERKSGLGLSTTNISLNRTGGLIFSQSLWPTSNSGLNKLKNSDASDTQVFNSNNVFWTYLNTYKPAKCDMYGMISFNNTLPSAYPRYVLSGQINFYKQSSLETYLKLDSTLTNMNQPGVMIAYPHSNNAVSTATGGGNFVVMSYMSAPIVNQGYAIFDTSSLTAKYTYDPSVGLISSSNNSTYALIYDNLQFLNNWYQDDELELNGSYVQVTKNEATHSITYNQKNYVYFQGIFLAANSVSSTTATGVNLDCMLGGSSSRDKVVGASSNCTLTYNQNLKRWSLTAVG